MNKFIHYGAQRIDGDDIQAVCRALRDEFITQGDKVKKFEDSLCEYTGAKYAVCVSSGTAALHLACRAIGIDKGDEVITSPITFVASANCILYCQGKPVFADIEEDTVNIDPQEAKSKITGKTKAIIPVHFAGHPCDLRELQILAGCHRKIAIIEDATHALGAQYRGEKTGSCRYSDMAAFSFHAVKHITTGEGGAVTTNNKKLYLRLLMLRSHGIYKDARLRRRYGPWFYQMRDLGFNYRLTDFQSALGLSQLQKLDKFLSLRRHIADIYSAGLSRLNSIILPSERKYVRSAWHLYVLRLKDPSLRRRVFEKLRTSNIGVQVHYIPVYLQPFYRHLGYRKGLCRRAEDYYRRTITLPLHQGMSNGDAGYVIKKLKEVLG